jgi:hypothetical protein
VHRDLALKLRPTADKRKPAPNELNRDCYVLAAIRMYDDARGGAMVDNQISADVHRIYDEPCADVVKRTRAGCALMAAATPGYPVSPTRSRMGCEPSQNTISGCLTGETSR